MLQQEDVILKFAHIITLFTFNGMEAGKGYPRLEDSGISQQADSGIHPLNRHNDTFRGVGRNSCWRISLSEAI